MKLDTEKIKQELDKRGWSIYRFGKEISMANQSLYKILNEGGDNFTLTTVQRFADALGVDGKDLLI